jgi:hypothetical protein
MVVHRREYSIEITVKGRSIEKVVIDPHYEIKHSRSVNDQTIISPDHHQLS